MHSTLEEDITGMRLPVYNIYRHININIQTACIYIYRHINIIYIKD